MMRENELPKEMVLELVELRKKNLEIREKYCKYIIKDESFKEWEDWEKARIIDMFNGVLEGDSLDGIEEALQMVPGNIKAIFLGHGIDIKKYGDKPYKQE